MSSTSTVLVTVLASISVTMIVAVPMTWWLTRRSLSIALGNHTVLQVADKFIDVLASVTIIVDETNRVSRASGSASSLGFVKNKSLAVPQLIDIVDTVRRFKEPVVDELEIESTPGNDVQWFSVRAAHASNGFVVLLLDDTTESQRLDQARRDFIANISHELKTPIGAIGLLAEALVNATDDPKMVRKFSKSLRKESRRLAELVQDIIQLSRVQSKDVLRRATPVRVSDIVADAIERCSVLAEARRIPITANTSESEFVIGDRELLTVAIKNLIDNAIQFSEEHQNVSVGVSSSKNMVRIAVADAGIGIPVDEQSRIFERFYRVDASRSRETGGTGLGLSLVKHIAFGHGGEITLFSEPDVGSTFTVHIPRYVPDNYGVVS